ncbi:hypothetical protein [Nonomuraea sp. B19D2]|uniref:hypothetical protein n=1 Tax=Nonomuraea sp. B19D2 TaxID=3159561 RepID=UPI0032D9ED93
MAVTARGDDVVHELDKEFTATLLKSQGKGGWTYVVMPGSAEFFGTRGLVKGSSGWSTATSGSRWRHRS